jgi:hypothetical protein
LMMPVQTRRAVTPHPVRSLFLKECLRLSENLGSLFGIISRWD